MATVTANGCHKHGPGHGLQRGGGNEGTVVRLPGLVPATFVMHNCLAFAARSAQLSSACEAFPQKVISGLCTRLGFVGLPADPTFLLDFQLAGQPRVGVNLIYACERAWERERDALSLLLGKQLELQEAQLGIEWHRVPREN